MHPSSILSRRIVVLLGALPIAMTGCVGGRFRTAAETRDHAFISYHPPPRNSGALRLAVKDIIDVKGEVTTAGSKYFAKNRPPAEQDAECVRLARARGVHIVGKTNTTEFAVSVSGKNDYFGTPRNYVKRGLIPGGSSSGSAAAVAGGTADVAFGTDTAGSIRVPAACCGVYGLKTTYGLVSMKGVLPLSPKHLDTVGPLAKDLNRLVKGMDLLQPGFAGKYAAAVANSRPARNIRVGRLYLEGTDDAVDTAVDAALKAAGFRVITLSKDFQKQWKQAQDDGEVIALADAWQSDQQYLDKSGVSLLTKAVITLGKVEHSTKYDDALRRQDVWQRELKRVFERVDFIALPTMQTATPKMPKFGVTSLFELQILKRQNTVPVNLAGVPALAIPVPLKDNGKPLPPTSLQLIGPRLSEARLLNAGRIVASKLKSVD